MKKSPLFISLMALMLVVITTCTGTFATPKTKTVEVGIYPNKPLVFFEDEEAKGFLVDILEEVAQRENWILVYKNYEFGDGLKALESNDVDIMVGVAYSDTRSKKYTFNTESVFVNWGQIYINSNSRVESFQDMYNARVGVYKNDIHYLGENGLKNTLNQFAVPVHYTEYEDKLSLFTALESGEVEVGIVNRTFGMQHDAEYNIKKTPIQLNPVNVHFATKKGFNEDLLVALDRALIKWKMDDDSFYHDRLNHWFESTVTEIMPIWSYYVLAAISGLLIVSAVVIYITQKIIHKQTYELKVLNQGLEEKVLDRTVDLNNSNAKLKDSLINLEEKQSELEEMNAILEEQVELIERTQGKLVEAEKMASLGRMVSSLAHELNTPLGICVTLHSNMKRDSKHIKKTLENKRLTKNCLVEYLDDMISATDMFHNNLETVVDLVERFKMLSSGKIQMNEREINLYEYLHAQMNALKPELRESSHKYCIECPRDINMVIDPSALSQVIRNLTMNSVIHGFDDRPSGQIDIHVKKKKERVLIEYADNGIGLSEGEKDKIFEPFYTTKRNQGGTGLGLSIVHSAVTQTLDGEIRIDERAKNGLKYEIELPMGEMSFK